MKQNRLSIGDYVVWKSNVNAKTEQRGFICQFERGVARMLVLLSDPDRIDKRSLDGIDLELKGRNREAVELGEIATNILEWPLHMVVLWYAAKNHVLNRGYWDLGAVVDICQQAQRKKAKDEWIKKSLVKRVRTGQRFVALNNKRRRMRFGLKRRTDQVGRRMDEILAERRGYR
jgi:hypothetical protein